MIILNSYKKERKKAKQFINNYMPHYNSFKCKINHNSRDDH